MPDIEEHGLRDRAHIEINVSRRTSNYTFPVRDQKRKALRLNYAEHAASLLDQIARALGEIPTGDDDRRLRVEGLKLGTLVEVTTLCPVDGSRVQAIKVPSTLDFPTQQIAIVRSARSDDRTERALLFVPDDARVFLLGRISNYGVDPAAGQRRADEDRFQVIETVVSAAAEALFEAGTDFASTLAVWWELWVRSPSVSPDQLASVGRAVGLDVHQDRLMFPDTTVLFVHASARGIADFAQRVPGAISEIRRSTGTIEPFLGGRTAIADQHDLVQELGARVSHAASGSPVVCVLDTGVAAAHALLGRGIHGAWAYDAAWGADDHYPSGGHGTSMASLVLYGDLGVLMSDKRSVQLAHAVESMKLLPPRGFPATQPPSYGFITQGAIAAVEIERSTVPRTFCLAISTADFPPDRPSSWSGAIDQIASGAMPGDEANGTPLSKRPKRLVMVSTGNVSGGTVAEVSRVHPLEDPAQSWNALSIGGFTAKEVPPAGASSKRPVVAANHRSPYSRGSQSLPYDLTPIKPEVLFEAGNMVANNDYCEWHPAVSLLAAGSDANGPLVPFWATSAATGLAGNFVGRLHAALPGLWPETYRALVVDSAQWPAPIRRRFIGRGNHWKTGSKGGKQEVLREVGYGVPDFERAIRSARNDVTLIAEQEIQPFAIGADLRSAVFNEMHLYDLPWPKRTLEHLENEVVTMKVTLSYFIEPNISGKAATRPDTYRSYGLRFAMKKRSETEQQFRVRIGAAQKAGEDLAETEKDCWLLGPKAVQAGSLHCDLWRGYAVDLAGHDAIAVYPVGGWWKSHVGQRRMTDKARYALTISLSAPGHQVDLHAEILSLVELQAQQIEATVE